MWLFCLLDPGQIRYRAIYSHPNQIPGYPSANDPLRLVQNLDVAKCKIKRKSCVRKTYSKTVRALHVSAAQLTHVSSSSEIFLRTSAGSPIIAKKYVIFRSS